MSNPTPTPADDLVERVAQVLCETDCNYFSRHMTGFPSRKWKSPGGGVYDTTPLTGKVLDRQRAKARAVVALVLGEAAKVADGYHDRALEWARNIRGLEQHIGDTDSKRIAAAIRALIPEGG